APLSHGRESSMPSLNRAALLVRAQACYRDRHYMQAMSIAEELLRANKKDTDAIEMLARIDMLYGRSDDAVAKMRKCIALEPQRGRFQVVLGGFYTALGEHANAAKCYERAVKLRSDDRDALAGLADA